MDASAMSGISGGGGKLPDADKIQQSFGGCDISNIQAHYGGPAAEASRAMGAEAYATSNHVVLGDGGKDLHTQAHEAAHVVQQKQGVSLSGGVGQAGDRYEQHADAVADRVVQGKSAEDLLGQMAGGAGGGGGVQMREGDSSPLPRGRAGPQTDKAADRDKMWAIHKGGDGKANAAKIENPATDFEGVAGKKSTEEPDPNAIEATRLNSTLCVDLRKMGHDFISHRRPDRTYVFQNTKDMSIELTPAQLQTRAQAVLAMHDEFDPDWLELIVKGFPQWVMENCYILPEEGLRYMLAKEPGRLRRMVNEMKFGSPPPKGNWAAFANAGAQAKKTIYPAITAFQWAMFINAGCILFSGAVAGVAFEIVRGAAQMAWAGIPRQSNGLKDLMAEALEPPKLTLATTGPLQREIIKTQYLNDDALVHRFFNARYPRAPFPLRAKLAASMAAIS